MKNLISIVIILIAIIACNQTDNTLASEPQVDGNSVPAASRPISYENIYEPVHPTALPAALLARFGSRTCLRFIPQKQRWHFHPLGTYTPPMTGMAFFLAVQNPDTEFQLVAGPNASAFRIDLERTPCRLSFTSRNTDLQLECRIEIVSPFWPGDPFLSGAPAFPLKIQVLNTGDHDVVGTFRWRLPQPSLTSWFREDTTDGHTILAAPHVVSLSQSAVSAAGRQSRSSDPSRGFLTGPNDDIPYTPTISGYLGAAVTTDGMLWDEATRTLSWPFHIAPGSSFTTEAFLAWYSNYKLLKVKNERLLFHYTSTASSIGDLLKRVIREWRAWETRTTQFESVFSPDWMGDEFRQLSGVALQSWLSNTWYMQRAAGEPYFSVWEGHPRFHSTLDVEFNNLPFYLQYWPELMELLLQNWRQARRDVWFPHDLGKSLIIDRVAYPVAMPVEETCNYILSVWSLWRMRGRNRLPAAALPDLTQLAAWLIATDTNENGLPDTGTENTLDDAPGLIHAAPDQVYLGVKMWAALQALADLAEARALPHWVRTCKKAAARITTTLEKNRLEFHYPVCLPFADPDRRTLLPFADNISAPGAELAGSADWNSKSIYGPLAFLPILWAGLGERIADQDGWIKHLQVTAEDCRTPYGSAHVAGSANVWVSQNLWRDMVAAWLGADVPWNERLRGYLQLQDDRNKRVGEDHQAGGFWDSPVNDFLSSYARGLAVCGLPAALTRQTVDRIRNRLTTHFPDHAQSLAIPMITDWNTGKPAEVVRPDSPVPVSGSCEFPLPVAKSLNSTAESTN